MINTMWHVDNGGLLVHDAFTAFGILVAGAIFVAEARRQGRLDLAMWSIGAGSLVGAAIGARAAFVWRYVTLSPEPTVRGFLLQGGKSVVGGLAGAYLGAVLTKHLLGYRDSTGDVFAPAIAVGLAVGRIGCLLTEPPGTSTSLPWGVRLTAAEIAATPGCDTCRPGVAYHPSFIYEIVLLVAIAASLVWLRRTTVFPGELFLIFLLSYSVVRFALEFTRSNPDMAFGLSGTQLLLLPSILVLGVRLTRRHHAAMQPAWDPGG